ncbi:iron-containing redox enzyme family protein [Pseudomonas fluorescens]|uniref:Iron-containing redox enzyme family protein n=1 Tax=Pseudomonas fluorescens TaxID=294 RepID=A0A5E7EGY2_PSEFL|nr:iron-containing redox enzyme family protein [Pseudomonas fluorescens]VVO26135.1 hypothetical protein PS691_04570 [Pseudomonas fluorescens]
MTALTTLELKAANVQPTLPSAAARQRYDELLYGPDELDKREMSRAFLQEQLRAAETLPNDLPADPQALQPWVEQHCASVARQYAEYLQGRKAGGSRRFFNNKAHALYFLQAVAPTKLVDGAWLHGLLRQWHDGRLDNLLRTYLEELGEGIPAQNHVLIYRKLLARHGLDPNACAQDPHYLQGTVQLALGQCAEEFLPEVIGYNLGYERLPLHLLISAYELRELGIDPYYFTLHVTIDNASSGHAHKAVQTVLQLLPVEAGRDDFYRRVALGYRLNDLGLGSTAVIQSFDLQREVFEMLERKRPFGQHMHSDFCRFAGKTVNQWLAAPGQLPAFLAMLESQGWIKRHQDPQASRFWKLIEGCGAAMFGVFSPYEKQLLHDWIAGDWQPANRPAPVWRERDGSMAQVADDPDIRHLQTQLAGCSGERQMELLIPWLSPQRHSHPAGLWATRLFGELKSSLR